MGEEDIILKRKRKFRATALNEVEVYYIKSSLFLKQLNDNYELKK